MVEHLPERSWELTQGDPVQTRDGAEIGQVAEVRGTFFRVDVALRPDFWLESACIDSVGSGGVLLNFDRDALEDHRRFAPED